MSWLIFFSLFSVLNATTKDLPRHIEERLVPVTSVDAQPFKFTEGPVYDSLRGVWFFTDRSGADDPSSDGVLRCIGQDGRAQPVKLNGVGRVIGTAFDGSCLLFTEAGSQRRVLKACPTKAEGPWQASNHSDGERRWLEPNDLAVDAASGVQCFTSTCYDNLAGSKCKDGGHEALGTGIYCRDPRNGNFKRVLSADNPNGILYRKPYLYYTLSGAERQLRRIRFTPANISTVGTSELLYDFSQEEGLPGVDGLTGDTAGNLLVAAKGKLWVFASQGRGDSSVPRLRQKLAVPGFLTNIAIGPQIAPGSYEALVTSGSNVFKTKVPFASAETPLPKTTKKTPPGGICPTEILLPPGTSPAAPLPSAVEQ